MFIVDDLEIELLFPDILFDYLRNNEIYEVFNVIDGNYYLIDNIDEVTKNTILNSLLSLLSNEVGNSVLESDELLEMYTKISSNIYFIDNMAKFSAKSNNYEFANNILMKKIREIVDFKNMLKDMPSNSFKI